MQKVNDTSYFLT